MLLTSEVELLLSVMMKHKFATVDWQVRFFVAQTFCL